MDPREFKRLLSAYRPVRPSSYVGTAWFDPKGAAAGIAPLIAPPSTKASPPKPAQRKARAASSGSAGGGASSAAEGAGGGDDFWAHLCAGFARHQQRACGKTAGEAQAIAAALVRRAREFHEKEELQRRGGGR